MHVNLEFILPWWGWFFLHLFVRLLSGHDITHPQVYPSDTACLNLEGENGQMRCSGPQGVDWEERGAGVAPCVVFSPLPIFITHSCDRIQEHSHMLANTIRNLSAQPLIASWQPSDHDYVMPMLYSLLTAPWKVCFENLSPIWPLTNTHTRRRTPELSLYYAYTRVNSLPATPLCFTFSAHCQECQVFAVRVSECVILSVWCQSHIREVFSMVPEATSNVWLRGPLILY